MVAAFCLTIRQSATNSCYLSHQLIKPLANFISTQTVTSPRPMLYNGARFAIAHTETPKTREI